MPPAQALIVEDDPMQAALLKKLVTKMKIDSSIVGDGRAALDFLASPEGSSVNLVLLDMMMPRMSGKETMAVLSRKYPDIPVIFITASKTVSHAVEAMQMGAFDYIEKPYDFERISFAIRNATKMSVLSRNSEHLKWAQTSTLHFTDLIGHTGGLADVVSVGRRVAATDVPVLIMGETGVGKEAFACALHNESSRRGKPFIAVNCGAIPENLTESILFGHEKGAFTGATEKTPGKFREADGGTIFLDEIGEMPLSAQIRLLRVLQQKEIEPVGSSRAIPISVRVISATNRDLSHEVAQGRFREDLFFRLNVMPITLPPLRQRREDIPALVQHFIDRFVWVDNLRRRAINPRALETLYTYDWPGNVRELENTVRRAMVLSDTEDLQPDDFSFTAPKTIQPTTSLHSKGARAESSIAKSSLFVSLCQEDGHSKTLAELEQEILHLVLRQRGGNVTAAARQLGLAKSTFYRKLKEVDHAGN